jgi:tyrosine-protein kinase Etk/Wzc
MEELKQERLDLNKLSFRDLFYKYIRFLPLYILFLTIALLSAWLYLRYAQEKYVSTGSMIINVGGGNNGDKVEALISEKNKGRSLQNEIEVLKSKSLLTRVVKAFNLEYNYVAKGKIKDRNAYKMTPFTIQALQLSDSAASFSLPIEFINAAQFKVDNSGANYNLGQVFSTHYGVFKLVKESSAVPGSKYVVNYNTAEAVASSIVANMNVQPKLPGTGILILQNENTNPILAADIVNGLMSEYNNLTIEQSNTSIDLTIGFVDRRLAVLERDIDSLQKQLLRFQRNNDLVDAGTQIKDYLSGAKEQDAVAQTQRMALSNLEEIENYLKDKESQHQRLVVPSTLGIADQTLNQMVSKYNEAQLERKSLLDANIPESNPKIAEAEKTIEILRKSTLENLNTLKASYSRLLGYASSEKTRNKGEALRLPAKVNEQVELERQLSSKLALFKILDQKREEASISRASQISGSKIVELAEPYLTPIKPNRTTIKLAAILLALAIPTLFLFLREVLNDRINTRSDIEKYTEAPILGEVGHSYSDKTLVADRGSRSLIAEQFRILRSNLQYITGKGDKAVILVTSSFGGEGKSFISTNMASVLALTEKKTIVLEFDLRKPRVLKGLDMSKRPGISNYMIGKSDLESLIVPVEEAAHLYVLPCGPIPPNPSELLLSERINELFTQLKQKFDYIIIDTAPVGMVSDALTLGKYADCTLYVTRQEHTFKKQIALIDEMYRTKKLPHISIILNDVKMPTGGGYYGNYGYGYGYGVKKGKSGYYDDELPPPQTFWQKTAGFVNPVNWFGNKS